jgi:hypothetical protein
MDAALQSAISTAAITLDGMGFTRTGEEFVRIRPEFIDCVAFQLRSDNAAFAVNLGVQPICMLELSRRTPAVMLAAREIDCYVRERLVPDGETDYWWPTAGNAVKVAAEVDELLRIKGTSFFNYFHSLVSSILPITVADIAEGRAAPYFSKLTRTRLALLATRANMEAKRFAVAKGLAEYGLKIAGMAVGPKREFKAVLSELEDLRL